MSSTLFALSLALSALLIGIPAYLADPSDAARLGFYGQDYEGNLCGHLAFRPDGSRARDMRARPFMYWLNATATVCVRRCPRLADELVCEYPFEAVPVERRRAQLGLRCFAQLRTRPSFPACLPYKPSAAAPIDRWLSTHAVDQLAADTLQASAVILGSWCAAGLASLVVLAGLVAAPRMTLGLTMVAILAITFSGAALLLPHGTSILAAARAPLMRQEALYWREEIPGFVQFSLGWAACAAVALLVLTLWQRARHAPLVAALLATAAKPLTSLPQLLLFPLYLFIGVGAPLSAWITAIVYLASPCAEAEGCGASATFWRVVWPLTLAAPYWIAAAVTAWAYCAAGGAVACWYADLAPHNAAGGGGGGFGGGGGGGGGAAGLEAGGATSAHRGLPTAFETPLKKRRPHSPPGAANSPRLDAMAYTPGASRRWPLWRSGWLALDAHFGSIGAAAFLLPLVSLLRIVLPPVHGAARPSVNPYSRACVGAIQGCLRLLASLTRSVHPGGLVYLARHTPIGAPNGVGGVGGGVGAALPPPRCRGFLDAGQRCADLFDFSEARVAAAREHAHYFYALLKWTISLGCALVGWLCLTNAEAPLLLSPLWPAAIILEGSFALASAALSVHEAALEAVLQSYCAEMRLEAAAAAADTLAAERAARAANAAHAANATAGWGGSGDDAAVIAERAAADRAAALFGAGGAAGLSDVGSTLRASDLPYLDPSAPLSEFATPAYGATASLGFPHEGPRGRAAAAQMQYDDTEGLEELPQVPPSYARVPLAASALAGV